ncbi:MAG: hydroxyacid dehydrogenase [Clostridiaceae bacterium]|nr:hydroxyacid dehydrogenase [Clostridiaceae bacterium]
MKMVIIEPLGVADDKLMEMASELKDKVEIVYYNTRTTDTQELIERGKDADIIVVSNLPLNREVIEGCRNLKLLSVAFTGVDHIAMEACRNQGVTVCNCAGYSTCAVADLVFGMLISLYRNVIPCDLACRRGGTKDGLVGFELEGKKFGVVGTGAIGERVALIAQAFGCEVYAYSRTVKDLLGVKYVDLDTLLSECDIVSLHTPLNAQTKGLINKENIKLMKKNAVLINTARGPVVDTDALAEALKEGRLAGACIDVFEKEPPIDENHPLLDTPNTIVTPHIAFATKEALVKRAVIVFDNVKRYLDGKPQNIIQ